MKFIRTTLFTLSAFFCIQTLQATPTSLFWTYCTTDVQEYGVGLIDVYNYFTLFSRPGHFQQLPIDTGFLLGFFSYHDIKGEIGVDYLGGVNSPVYFNTKVGVEENKLFKNAPSVSAGMFNIGTRTRSRRATNQNVVDLVIGKELPEKIGGTLYLGGYIGTKAIGTTRGSAMIGYLQKFCKEKYCDKEEYYKWAFAADYAWGKNAIGGGGFAIEYYFTPDIYIETGPVWFNDAKINGTWKWGVQFYFNIPIFNKK